MELVQFASNQGFCRKTGFSKDFFSSKNKIREMAMYQVKKPTEAESRSERVFGSSSVPRYLMVNWLCIENPGEAG